MSTNDKYDSQFQRKLTNWSYAYANETFNKFRYHKENRGIMMVNLELNDTRYI